MTTPLLIPVIVRPLLVTAVEPAPECAIALCPQILWAAGLQAGGQVEIHNHSTGGRFRALMRSGGAREVRVQGATDPGLAMRDVLMLVANERGAPSAPGGSTVCLCEKNQVIEIRHASAPPLLADPTAETAELPGAHLFTD